MLASPLYWVTPDVAPMLLIHGTKDPIVSFHQAEEMRDRLKDAAVEVEFMPIYPGERDGFRCTRSKKPTTRCSPSSTST